MSIAHEPDRTEANILYRKEFSKISIMYAENRQRMEIPIDKGI